MSEEELKETLEFTKAPEEEQVGTVLESISDVEYDDSDDYIEGGDESTNYKVDHKKEALVNTASGEVTTPEQKPMTPWDLIVQTAKAMNVEIRDPKKNCKNCFGRGWTGIDVTTKNPVVCQCIFPTKTPAEKQKEYQSEGYQKVAMAGMSREQRRRFAKINKKALRQMAIEKFANKEDQTDV